MSQFEKQVFTDILVNIVPNGINNWIAKNNIDELNGKLTEFVDNGLPDCEPIDKTACYRGCRSMPFDRDIGPQMFAHCGDKILWLKAPMPNWTVDVCQNGDTLYGLDYWYNYHKDEFLDVFRERSDNYTLTYKHYGVMQFKVHVYKFIKDGWNMATIRAEFVVDDTADTKPACEIPLGS